MAPPHGSALSRQQTGEHLPPTQKSVSAHSFSSKHSSPSVFRPALGTQPVIQLDPVFTGMQVLPTGQSCFHGSHSPLGTELYLPLQTRGPASGTTPELDVVEALVVPPVPVAAPPVPMLVPLEHAAKDVAPIIAAREKPSHRDEVIRRR